MPNKDGPVLFWTVVCLIPACFSTAAIYHYLVDDDPHYSFLAFARHKLAIGKDIPDIPLNQHAVPNLAVLPSQFALFLYNSTMPHHVEFMHDVRVANWRHSISIYKNDCVKFHRLCAERGHGEVHEYEPPTMFYHGGEWSESYHDDIQVGKVAKPSTRGERVETLLRWLDRASEQAGDKIFEREQMFARYRAEGSPSQKMMRKMQKEHDEKKAKEDAEKQKVEL